MSLGLAPYVLFAKHTDLTVFGSAAALELGFSVVLNGPGSWSATFPAEDLRGITWVQDVLGTDENAYVWNRPGFVLIQDDTAVREAFAVEGVVASNAADVWAGTITLSGRGIESCLDYVTVQQLQLGCTKLFEATPRAEVWLELLGQGQARTAVPFVTTAFTATLDSAASAWSDVDNVRVRDGGTLLSLFTSYGDSTWDWHMRPDGVLDAWILAGVDLSGSVSLSPYAHGTSVGSETIDMRSLFTAAFAEIGAGSGGVGGSSADSTKVARYGERESYQSLGGIDEMSQISVLGGIADDQAIFTNSRTYAIDPTVEGGRPYVDFNLGDIVTIVASSLKDYNGTVTTTSVARVMGWGWRRAEDGTQICDLTLDHVLQHRRRKFESEQIISQGIVPIVLNDGAAVSTNDGRVVGTDNVNPYLAAGPDDPGLIHFIMPGIL